MRLLKRIINLSFAMFLATMVTDSLADGPYYFHIFLKNLGGAKINPNLSNMYFYPKTSKGTSNGIGFAVTTSPTGVNTGPSDTTKIALESGVTLLDWQKPSISVTCGGPPKVLFLQSASAGKGALYQNSNYCCYVSAILGCTVQGAPIILRSQFVCNQNASTC